MVFMTRFSCVVDDSVYIALVVLEGTLVVEYRRRSYNPSSGYDSPHGPLGPEDFLVTMR